MSSANVHANRYSTWNAGVDSDPLRNGFAATSLDEDEVERLLMHASDIQIIGVDSKLQQWYYWGQAWVSEVRCVACCCMQSTLAGLLACQKPTA